MGSKIINFKDLKVEHPNRYKVTDSNGTEDVKKIDFDPGLIYQQGTPESAENFNNIQKNCIYEVSGVRILEGQEEIYDISIDGFDNFEFESLKILMTPNATNTIKGSFVRLNGAKYIIKNRIDSIGIGQIFSGESVFISLNFTKKTATVVAILGGGSTRTLKEIDDDTNRRVSKTGDTMTGELALPRIRLTSAIDDFVMDYNSAGWWYIGNQNSGFLRFLDKTGFQFTTGINISGNAVATKFLGPVQGNADSATKLATAKQINGTDFDGAKDITTANWGTARSITIGKISKTVNGGSDVSYSLSEIGAVSKTGDTITGQLRLNTTANSKDLVLGSNKSGGKEWHFLTFDGASEALRFYDDGFIRINDKRIYHGGNKPTKTDIGLGDVGNYSAVNKTGDVMTGVLRFSRGDKAMSVGDRSSDGTRFFMGNETHGAYLRFWDNGVIDTNKSSGNLIGQGSLDAYCEEGSNEYGTYRKWTNGTLECWVTGVNLLVGENKTLNYPHRFLNYNIACFVSNQGDSLNTQVGNAKVIDPAIVGSTTQFRVYNGIAGMSVDAKFAFYFKGVWK